MANKELNEHEELAEISDEKKRQYVGKAMSSGPASDKRKKTVNKVAGELRDKFEKQSVREGVEGDIGSFSKTNAMSVMMKSLSGMDKDMIVQIFNQVMDGIGHEADQIPGDAAAKNAASIAMKGAIKEDIEAVFGGEELSEEFKEKATVLFEAAVDTRVAFIKAELEEQFQTSLSEEVGKLTEDLVDKVDEYINYAADTWMEENEVAIESSLRNEIAESLLQGIGKLFSEHNINLPEEQVDAVEALTRKVEVLEGKLNEAVDENIGLKKVIEENTKEKVIAKLSEGLALSQTEKFRTLVEGIECDGDLEAFERKLTIIKDHHFKGKAATTTNLITEEITHSDDESAPTSANEVPVEMRPYVTAISRTIKR